MRDISLTAMQSPHQDNTSPLIVESDYKTSTERTQNDLFSEESLLELDIKKPHVNYFNLLKYASKLEIFLYIFGCLMSCAVGTAAPLTFYFFSDIVNSFVGSTIEIQKSLDDLIQRFAILGAGTFIAAYLQMLCLQLTAKFQAKRIRGLLYKKILEQDVEWFENNPVGTLITNLTEGVEKIQVGVGEKFGMFVQSICVFIGGIVLCFTKNWELSLMACAVFPLVVGSFTLLGFMSARYIQQQGAAYSRANGIASEVFSSIKTIFAFEGQEKELKRYSSELHTAEKLGIKMNRNRSLFYGMGDCSLYILIAVLLYYGMVMLTEERAKPGEIIMIVFIMLWGAIAIGTATKQIDYFGSAVASASEIFPILDRVPPINKLAPGIIPSDIKGEITFQNVSFTYPMRKDVQVLNQFTLTIEAGKTVAIVGPSGSGKSTCIQLIQRFYDSTDGKVLIDGENILDLDLRWLRSNLGVVSQEPVLFAGTVAENIRLGKSDANQTEIENAAKLARAHEFITKLPQAYDTILTSGSGGMSGGQKQRIAIARALIRNPHILLLDEATSALDTKSEKAVQKAIDAAKKGRTVIMVAHRLSTVKNADVIVVVDRGTVQEQGTHKELMQKNGLYASLVNESDQKLKETIFEAEDDVEDDDDVLNSMNINEAKIYDDRSDILSSDASGITSTVLESKDKLHKSREILKMNRPELCFIVIGIITSAISGSIQAASSILYTDIYNIFFLLNNDEKLKKTGILAGVLVAFGLARMITLTIGGQCWGISGERLTKRVRSMLFESMLNQEVAWFDDVKNQPGPLTATLASEVPALEGVSGRSLGSLFEVLFLIAGSLAIALFYSWQIALVTLAYFPVLLLVAAFDMSRWTSYLSPGSIKGAGLAHETFTCAKTVFGLGAEDHFVQQFHNSALDSNKKLVKSSLSYALLNAVSNSMNSFQFAGVFYAGGKLISTGKIKVLGLFRAYVAISMAAQNLGFAAAFAPDTKKAAKAATNILSILKRDVKLQRNQGETPQHKFKGTVSFKHVSFRYPTRKRIDVLKDFEYEVPSGKSVALVGQSGCGKSTVLQLVQRFYDPTEGKGIFFDKRNIHDLTPNWIRRQIGIVSQEPNLLDMTIKENIAYGLNYEENEPTMEVIIEAAKQANAHNFIMDLPEGYATRVGAGGSQLSGGQKQRVAIARALIRNPRLLLLDEATAALDNESERVVQSALDKAMRQGARTTFLVAHRLSTVANCDIVVVLEGGKVVESGSPSELMEAKGAYYSLHNSDGKTKWD